MLGVEVLYGLRPGEAAIRVNAGGGDVCRNCQLCPFADEEEGGGEMKKDARWEKANSHVAVSGADFFDAVYTMPGSVAGAPV